MSSFVNFTPRSVIRIHRSNFKLPHIAISMRCLSELAHCHPSCLIPTNFAARLTNTRYIRNLSTLTDTAAITRKDFATVSNEISLETHYSLKYSTLETVLTDLASTGAKWRYLPKKFRADALNALHIQIIKFRSLASRENRFDEARGMLETFSALGKLGCNFHHDLVLGDSDIGSEYFNCISYGLFSESALEFLIPRVFSTSLTTLSALVQQSCEWGQLNSECQENVLNVIKLALTEFVATCHHSSVSTPFDRLLSYTAKLGIVLPPESLDRLIDCATIYLWQLKSINQGQSFKMKVIKYQNEGNGSGILSSISKITANSLRLSEGILELSSAVASVSNFYDRVVDYTLESMEYADYSRGNRATDLLNQFHALGLTLDPKSPLWEKIQSRILSQYYESNDTSTVLIAQAALNRHPLLTSDTMLDEFRAILATSETPIATEMLYASFDDKAKAAFFNNTFQALGYETLSLHNKWDSFSPELKVQILSCMRSAINDSLLIDEQLSSDDAKSAAVFLLKFFNSLGAAEFNLHKDCNFVAEAIECVGRGFNSPTTTLSEITSILETLELVSLDYSSLPASSQEIVMKLVRLGLTSADPNRISSFNAEKLVQFIGFSGLPLTQKDCAVLVQLSKSYFQTNEDLRAIKQPLAFPLSLSKVAETSPIFLRSTNQWFYRSLLVYLYNSLNSVYDGSLLAIPSILSNLGHSLSAVDSEFAHRLSIALDIYSSRIEGLKENNSLNVMEKSIVEADTIKRLREYGLRITMKNNLVQSNQAWIKFANRQSSKTVLDLNSPADSSDMAATPHEGLPTGKSTNGSLKSSAKGDIDVKAMTAAYEELLSSLINSPAPTVGDSLNASLKSIAEGYIDVYKSYKSPSVAMKHFEHTCKLFKALNKIHLQNSGFTLAAIDPASRTSLVTVIHNALSAFRSFTKSRPCMDTQISTLWFCLGHLRVPLPAKTMALALDCMVYDLTPPDVSVDPNHQWNKFVGVDTELTKLNWLLEYSLQSEQQLAAASRSGAAKTGDLTSVSAYLNSLRPGWKSDLAPLLTAQVAKALDLRAHSGWYVARTSENLLRLGLPYDATSDAWARIEAIMQSYLTSDATGGTDSPLLRMQWVARAQLPLATYPPALRTSFTRLISAELRQSSGDQEAALGMLAVFHNLCRNPRSNIFNAEFDHIGRTMLTYLGRELLVADKHRAGGDSQLKKVRHFEELLEDMAKCGVSWSSFPKDLQDEFSEAMGAGLRAMAAQKSSASRIHNVLDYLHSLEVPLMSMDQLSLLLDSVIHYTSDPKVSRSGSKVWHFTHFLSQLVLRTSAVRDVAPTFLLRKHYGNLSKLQEALASFLLPSINAIVKPRSSLILPATSFASDLELLGVDYDSHGTEVLWRRLEPHVIRELKLFQLSDSSVEDGSTVSGAARHRIPTCDENKRIYRLLSRNKATRHAYSENFWIAVSSYASHYFAMYRFNKAELPVSVVGAAATAAGMMEWKEIIFALTLLKRFGKTWGNASDVLRGKISASLAFHATHIASLPKQLAPEVRMELIEFSAYVVHLLSALQCVPAQEQLGEPLLNGLVRTIISLQFQEGETPGLSLSEAKRTRNAAEFVRELSRLSVSWMKLDPEIRSDLLHLVVKRPLVAWTNAVTGTAGVEDAIAELPFQDWLSALAALEASLPTEMLVQLIDISGWAVGRPGPSGSVASESGVKVVGRLASLVGASPAASDPLVLSALQRVQPVLYKCALEEAPHLDSTMLSKLSDDFARLGLAKPVI